MEVAAMEVVNNKVDTPVETGVANNNKAATVVAADHGEVKMTDNTVMTSNGVTSKV